MRPRKTYESLKARGGKHGKPAASTATFGFFFVVAAVRLVYRSAGPISQAPTVGTRDHIDADDDEAEDELDDTARLAHRHPLLGRKKVHENHKPDYHLIVSTRR